MVVKYFRDMLAEIINKRNAKISREQTAELIEIWVNNPDISLNTLGDKYGINASHVSALITKIWFNKRESFTTRIAVRQSVINEEQLKLKLSA